MIPNVISLSRIFLVIPIIYLIASGNEYLALLIFLLGCLTDFMDGFLARKYNQESILGENLDLLADKLFICILLVFLPFHFDNFLLLFFSILLIARELVIGSVRQYFLSINLVKKSKVNFLGKSKTFFQMISVGSAIIFMSTSYEYISLILFSITLFLAWFSLFIYLRN
jgi:CDP-diacylglycerol--glycerol-3-phosphate 3-phosphatidyltransferase